MSGVSDTRNANAIGKQTAHQHCPLTSFQILLPTIISHKEKSTDLHQIPEYTEMLLLSQKALIKGCNLLTLPDTKIFDCSSKAPPIRHRSHNEATSENTANPARIRSPPISAARSNALIP